MYNSITFVDCLQPIHFIIYYHYYLTFLVGIPVILLGESALVMTKRKRVQDPEETSINNKSRYDEDDDFDSQLSPLLRNITNGSYILDMRFDACAPLDLIRGPSRKAITNL